MSETERSSPLMKPPGQQGRIFDSLAHSLERFHRYLSYLSAAGMFLMILPTVADVCGRLLFDAPLRGSFEFTGLVMALVIYMGIPFAQTERTHVRVSFLVERMPPGAQRSVEALVWLFSVAVTGLVSYATAAQAVYSVKVGEYMYGSTRFPMWPSRVLVTLGLLFLGLQFLVDFFRSVAQSGHGKQRS